MPTGTECAIDIYMQVVEGQMPAFLELCKKFTVSASEEEGCLYYSYCFDGNDVCCRQTYVDAAGVLQRVRHVGELMESKFIGTFELQRLEVFGPAEELDKLRQPLADFHAKLYAVEFEYRA